MRPSSTTGQALLMKRASEVPPLVDSAGRRPVTASTAPATRSVKGPRSVTKASALVESKSSERRAPPTAATLRAVSADRVLGVQRSLKRTLKTSRTWPGRTLAAGGPTSGRVDRRAGAPKAGAPARTEG